MEPFVGEIQIVGFNYAPEGWLFCNGQLLSIAQYQVLYALIGTTYGGDGVQTFAVPNLQSRIPVGQGAGPGLSPKAMGQAAGSETVTLQTTQIPSHSHAANANAGAGNQSSPAGGIWAGYTSNIYGTAPAAVAMKNTLIANAGGNQPHDNIMPYLSINFIIAYQGIFPTQD